MIPVIYFHLSKAISWKKERNKERNKKEERKKKKERKKINKKKHPLGRLRDYYYYSPLCIMWLSLTKRFYNILGYFFSLF